MYFSEATDLPLEQLNRVPAILAGTHHATPRRSESRRGYSPRSYHGESRRESRSEYSSHDNHRAHSESRRGYSPRSYHGESRRESRNEYSSHDHHRAHSESRRGYSPRSYHGESRRESRSEYSSHDHHRAHSESRRGYSPRSYHGESRLCEFPVLTGRSLTSVTRLICSRRVDDAGGGGLSSDVTLRDLTKLGMVLDPQRHKETDKLDNRSLAEVLFQSSNGLIDPEGMECNHQELDRPLVDYFISCLAFGCSTQLRKQRHTEIDIVPLAVESVLHAAARLHVRAFLLPLSSAIHAEPDWSGGVTRRGLLPEEFHVTVQVADYCLIPLYLFLRVLMRGAFTASVAPILLILDTTNASVATQIAAAVAIEQECGSFLLRKKGRSSVSLFGNNALLLKDVEKKVLVCASVTKIYHASHDVGNTVACLHVIATVKQPNPAVESPDEVFGRCASELARITHIPLHRCADVSVVSLPQNGVVQLELSTALRLLAQPHSASELRVLARRALLLVIFPGHKQSDLLHSHIEKLQAVGAQLICPLYESGLASSPWLGPISKVPLRQTKGLQHNSSSPLPYFQRLLGYFFSRSDGFGYLLKPSSIRSPAVSDRSNATSDSLCMLIRCVAVSAGLRDTKLRCCLHSSALHTPWRSLGTVDNACGTSFEFLDVTPPQNEEISRINIKEPFSLALLSLQAHRAWGTTTKDVVAEIVTPIDLIRPGLRVVALVPVSPTLPLCASYVLVHISLLVVSGPAAKQASREFRSPIGQSKRSQGGYVGTPRSDVSAWMDHHAMQQSMAQNAALVPLRLPVSAPPQQADRDDRYQHYVAMLRASLPTIPSDPCDIAGYGPVPSLQHLPPLTDPGHPGWVPLDGQRMYFGPPPPSQRRLA